jgi:hypothetical protein
MLIFKMRFGNRKIVPSVDLSELNKLIHQQELNKLLDTASIRQHTSARVEQVSGYSVNSAYKGHDSHVKGSDVAN